MQIKHQLLMATFYTCRPRVNLRHGRKNAKHDDRVDRESTSMVRSLNKSIFGDSRLRVSEACQE